MAITDSQRRKLAATVLLLAAEALDDQSERRANVGRSLIRAGERLPAYLAADDVQDAIAFEQAKRDALVAFADHLGLDTSSGALRAVNAWQAGQSGSGAAAVARGAAVDLQQQAGGVR